VSRTAIQTIAGAAAAGVATRALSVVANWRLALMVGVIAAAIAATRMRYARLMALALLALVLGLASAGLSAGSDDRTAAHTGSAVRCAPVSAARGPARASRGAGAQRDLLTLDTPCGYGDRLRE
jgi:hypothetical protein